MPQRVELSRAETEVARIVWNLGEARLRDVVAAMPSGRQIDPATVQTYLRRLKAKGYLRTQRVGRVDVYSPSVQPAGVVKAAVREFVNRLFSGDAFPLMQQLINDKSLSDEQLAQLQKTLNDLKSRRSKS
jgi:predicted transcriptional regulator